MKTWLFIDANNLAWRNYHGIKHRRNVGIKASPVELIESFLNTLLFLGPLHRADGYAFCFDEGRQKRQDLFPDYKKSRQPAFMTAAEKKEKERVNIQITKLKEILPALGFANVFSKSGYEADDLLASCYLALPENDKGIIVTSDKDLFQLLDKNLSVWTHKKLVSPQSFEKEYGIKPNDWPWVKSMVGCPSDGIPGVKGVGEITAIKYLKGTLDKESAYYKRIMADNADVVRERNMKLIDLPYPGTPAVVLQEDEKSGKWWDLTIEAYGLQSQLKGRSHDLWPSTKSAIRGSH